MSAGFLSTALSVALGSGLALGAMLAPRAGGTVRAAPAVHSALNREIERRLDLVVNGSASLGARSSTPISGSRPGIPGPHHLDPIATQRTYTTLTKLGFLGGFLIGLAGVWAGIGKAFTASSPART